MDRRGHADHEITVERDRQVVPRIGQKLGRPAGIDGVVEDIGRDAVEHGRVARFKDVDFQEHGPFTVLLRGRGRRGCLACYNGGGGLEFNGFHEENGMAKVVRFTRRAAPRF